MRIAFSGFVADGGKSGVGTYIKGLLEGLQEIDKRNEYNLFFKETDQKVVFIKNDHFHLKISSNFVGKPIVNILWHNSVFPFLSWQKKYDVLHVPTFRRIPLVKGCRVVATVHDLGPLILPGKYDFARTCYHRFFLKNLIHRCDHVISVSQATKADIVRYTRYPEDKITVIHSGIDTTCFRPGSKVEAKQIIEKKYGVKDPFFVYVSRVEHPGKNHLNLIKAFEQFAKENAMPYRLLLAGADWSGAHVVKEYATKSFIKDRIHFLGFVSQEDVVRLYQACDLMIFPSLFEGFGFPILEAMACGARVSCSYIPALEEVAGGYAHFFDPLHPESIKESLMLSVSQEENGEYRQQQIDYARSFVWTECAKKVLKIYEGV